MLLRALICFNIIGYVVVENDSQNFAEEYLKRFGHLPKHYNNSVAEHNNILQDAILNFQNFTNLPMTGSINDKVLAMMKQPRCRMMDTNHLNRCKRYALYGTRRQSSEISYRIVNYTNIISKETVQKEIARAFGMWKKYVELNFIPTENKNAEIIIHFSEVDGLRGTAACAQSPPYHYIHFDIDETWSDESTTPLYQIAVHEIGHSLGLLHSKVNGSVMEEMLIPNKKFDNDLHPDDIKGIQKLYPTYNQRQINKRVKDFLCSNGKLNAIIKKNNEILYFKNNHILKVSLNAKPQIRKSADMYPEISGNSKVLYFNNKTYFFNEHGFYKYNKNNILDGKYPKKISKSFKGIPDDINAILLIQRKIAFFKGDKYWMYNTAKIPRVMDTFPLRTEELLKGFPSNLEVVYDEEDTMNIIGIKNDMVYKYNITSKAIENPIRLKEYFNCN